MTSAWAFAICVASIILLAVWFVLFWPTEREDVDHAPEAYTMTDCDRSGHAYRQQLTPRVYRCVNCGDVVESTTPNSGPS